MKFGLSQWYTGLLNKLRHCFVFQKFKVQSFIFEYNEKGCETTRSSIYKLNLCFSIACFQKKDILKDAFDQNIMVCSTRPRHRLLRVTWGRPTVAPKSRPFRQPLGWPLLTDRPPPPKATPSGNKAAIHNIVPPSFPLPLLFCKLCSASMAVSNESDPRLPRLDLMPTT